MAILYTKEGNSYLRKDKVNSLISPCKLSNIDLGLINFDVTKNLTERDLPIISSEISKQVNTYLNNHRMSFAGGITFWSGSDEVVKSDVSSNSRPHINYNDEIYFMLDGELVFYLKIQEDIVALLLQPGDYMYYDGSVEHWINPTKKQRFSIICYQKLPVVSNKQKEFTSPNIGQHFSFIE